MQASGGFRRALTAAAVVICLVAGACSGHNNATQSSEQDTSTTANTEGSGTVCAQLGDSKSLSELDQAIPALAVGSPDQDSVASAHKVSELLKRLEPDAADSLAPAMNRAATALDAVATTSNSQSVEELAAAFTALGQEVQSECNLPLGK
jgi:hypothetical protein